MVLRVSCATTAELQKSESRYMIRLNINLVLRGCLLSYHRRFYHFKIDGGIVKVLQHFTAIHNAGHAAAETFSCVGSGAEIETGIQCIGNSFESAGCWISQAIHCIVNTIDGQLHELRSGCGSWFGEERQAGYILMFEDHHCRAEHRREPIEPNRSEINSLQVGYICIEVAVIGAWYITFPLCIVLVQGSQVMNDLPSGSFW